MLAQLQKNSFGPAFAADVSGQLYPQSKLFSITVTCLPACLPVCVCLGCVQEYKGWLQPLITHGLKQPRHGISMITVLTVSVLSSLCYHLHHIYHAWDSQHSTAKQSPNAQTITTQQSHANQVCVTSVDKSPFVSHYGACTLLSCLHAMNKIPKPFLLQSSTRCCKPILLEQAEPETMMLVLQSL